MSDNSKNQEVDIPSSNIVFIGNPGVGKSTLLNSLIRKAVFKSGVSLGVGLTKIRQQHTHECVDYWDSPGLFDIDIKNRENAAKEIEKILRVGGGFKIFFVCTMESGRSIRTHASMIRLVLESIDEEVEFQYSIILNKLTPEVMQKFEIADHETLKLAKAGLVPPSRPTDSFFFYPFIEKINDRNNELHSPPREFVEWVNQQPFWLIQSENVKEIEVNKIDRLREELGLKIKNMKEGSEELNKMIHHLNERNKELNESLRKQEEKKSTEKKRSWIQVGNILKTFDVKESHKYMKVLRLAGKLKEKDLMECFEFIRLASEYKENEDIVIFLRKLSQVLDLEKMTQKVDEKETLNLIPKNRVKEFIQVLHDISKTSPGEIPDEKLRLDIDRMMISFHQDFGLLQRRIKWFNDINTINRENMFTKFFLGKTVEELLHGEYLRVVCKDDFQKERWKYTSTAEKFRVNFESEEEVESLEKCRSDDIRKLEEEVCERDFIEFKPTHKLGGRFGRGAFATTVSGIIKGMFGHFALKFITNYFGEDECGHGEMMRRDFLRIWHPNLVYPVGRNYKDFKGFDPQKICGEKKGKKPEDLSWKSIFMKKVRPPNSQKVEEEEEEGEEDIDCSFGVVIMKDYHNNLENYLFRRLMLIHGRIHETKRADLYFSNLELCSILKKLLKGGECLHEKSIVHRDLHMSNVFVIPEYGELYIGDFGVSVDLSEKDLRYFNKEEERFIVHKKDECLLYNFEEGEYRGGAGKFLPPEARKGDVIDYTKSDIYSIGVIMFMIIKSQFMIQDNDVSFLKKKMPFELIDPLTMSNEERDLVEICQKQNKLNMEYSPSIRICKLVMNLVNPKSEERYDYTVAIPEVDEIIREEEEKLKKQQIVGNNSSSITITEEEKEKEFEPFYFVKDEYKDLMRSLWDISHNPKENNET